MRVLILDTDNREARAIAKALDSEQFAVDISLVSKESWDVAIGTQYDVIVLSIAETNVSFLQKLRSQGISTPILAVDESGFADTRCKALAAGADDCITKPFLLQELVMRLRVLLRRAPALIDKLKVGDLELDNVRRTVIRQGKSIYLTRKEFAILEFLMRNAGRPVTRTMLVEHVWNGGFHGLTNIVDVYINYLRSKVDRDFENKLIHTAFGIGYLVVDQSNQDVLATT